MQASGIGAALAAAISLSSCNVAETEIAPVTCSAPGEVHTLAQILATYPAVLVGEHHGTREMPAAFAQLVDRASQDGRTVTIALEYDLSWAGVLTDMYTEPSEIDARAAFEGKQTGDGRTSMAALDMMITFRRLFRSGRDIRLVPVDEWGGVPEGYNRLQYP